MADSEEEELDPRIEVELERLNTSSTDINKFEKDLEAIQRAFVELSRGSNGELAALQKRLGSSCVEKARPYYTLKQKLEKTQQELHACTQEYERYIMGLSAAQDMLVASEEARTASPDSDTCKVMVSISQKKISSLTGQLRVSKQRHSSKCIEVAAINEQMQQLRRQHTRAVQKAEPYFQLYEAMCSKLDTKKKKLQDANRKFDHAKREYSEALLALERISNEIHQARQSRRPSMAHVERTSSSDQPSDQQHGAHLGVPATKVAASLQALSSSSSSNSSSCTKKRKEVTAISHDTARRLRLLPLRVTVSSDMLFQRTGSLSEEAFSTRKLPAKKQLSRAMSLESPNLGACSVPVRAEAMSAIRDMSPTPQDEPVVLASSWNGYAGSPSRFPLLGDGPPAESAPESQ